jgi:hypothetical protein
MVGKAGFIQQQLQVAQDGGQVVVGTALQGVP